MAQHNHAVIWIDHAEARIFHFDTEDVERLVLHPERATRHIHHKANEIGSGHAAEDQHFLHSVAEAIGDAGEVLITGPAGAKTALVKHIAHHDPQFMARIVGVETADHPTDGQIVDHARRYFSRVDRTTTQKA